MFLPESYQIFMKIEECDKLKLLEKLQPHDAEDLLERFKKHEKKEESQLESKVFVPSTTFTSTSSSSDTFNVSTSTVSQPNPFQCLHQSSLPNTFSCSSALFTTSSFFRYTILFFIHKTFFFFR